MLAYSIRLTALSHSSDADPDVLAEYVLAILKSDVPDTEIRAQMLEHLPDFLSEREISIWLRIGAFTDL